MTTLDVMPDMNKLNPFFKANHLGLRLEPRLDVKPSSKAAFERSRSEVGSSFHIHLHAQLPGKSTQNERLIIILGCTAIEAK
ncbi:hypothetical protein MJO28_014281 [Puccinia striiformis f. sp. tritici]|uniref:Uncharacterized protein n=1 Tax=Puccinia striiformis f. sp. tritici TaxID=168172 RepID=A0ACC0DTG4_9BASI|nr:hypothetical protein MJO28_014281 [Puccinia striiformis f. sp. tritici]